MGTWTRLPSSLRGGIASAVRFHPPKPEWKHSGGDDSVWIVGNRAGHRRQESRSAGGVWPPAGRPQTTRPRRRSDVGGHPAAGSWTVLPPGRRNRRWGVFSVEGGSFLPIGERTSDKGVRVRQKGFSRCAAGFSYVAGCLAIPAPLAYWPCHTEDTGGGRERPSFLDCLDWHSRGSACARPCYPPGGSLPSLNQSLREGCRADRAHRWLLSETAAVATVTSMRLKTPAMTTLRYRCTGDGLDCNAIVV